MKIYQYKDYEEVSKAAGDLIIEKMKKTPAIILGLATGSSPLGMYKYLIKAYNNHQISFKNVKTFNLDEYIGIDRSHPQSYYSYMHKHFFDHIDIKEHNIYIPASQEERIESLADDYNNQLKGNQRDIQILGIGDNAHIGFNEPGTTFDNQTFIVKLSEETRQANSRFFDRIEDVPNYAITMGIKNIMYSKKILLIASGKSKADALYKMVYGSITEEVPASILQLHPDVTVLVDREAASKLNMDCDFLEF